MVGANCFCILSRMPELLLEDLREDAGVAVYLLMNSVFVIVAFLLCLSF